MVHPQQIPPTPTPMPTLAPEEWAIQLPDISLWDYAPNMVGYWNQASIATEIFQAIIFAILVMSIMLYFVKRWRKYQEQNQVQ